MMRLARGRVRHEVIAISALAELGLAGRLRGRLLLRRLGGARRRVVARIGLWRAVAALRAGGEQQSEAKRGVELHFGCAGAASETRVSIAALMSTSVFFASAA